MALGLTVSASTFSLNGKVVDASNNEPLAEATISIPELQQNPLVPRVIDIFDTDGNGEIDFKGIVFV